ncbi:MAG TPA: glycosyltransferase family 1 protein [Candidatus Sulfopaludibacter sp.]|nr:glycosyltransferase family 1 protein [Candidatus Sulfopaludibacter sp.]
MPLHIAIDVRRVRDFGIGTYIRSLVHALAGIDDSNRYTLVIGPRDARTLAGLPENFSTVVYARDDHSYLDHATFPIFLHRLSPDLVHIPLARVPLLMIRPYVVTIHDMANLLFVEETSKLRMRLRRYRFRRGLVRAERVIAVSEATRRDCQSVLGIPPERIARVYNAPDPGFFACIDDRDAEQRRRILERYQIDYPFLLYAGNIRRHKNVPRLVEAFAVLREELGGHPVYQDLRLVIIGDTISQFPAVRQAVIRSKMEHVVRFLGFVPFETLRCFYQTAAAFVFPSRYEGFGLPPLEAMACGTPVVASNVSSLPEVVGDAAVLVNPENVFDIARGVREVLLDDARRADLIQRGRAQAARFSWDRTARQVLEIYTQSAR